MAHLVWLTLNAILRLNTRVYGIGSSRELCRDLAGTYSPKGIYPK